MKKLVLKLEVYDDRIKQKAMKAVSGLSGVESVSMDMKDKKLTLTGDIDPVQVVAKLRKLCSTEIVSVGPAKEEKKADPNKKDADQKKPDEKNKDSSTKENNVIDPQKLYEAYPYYNNYYYQMKPPQYNTTQYYYGRSVEEDPNGCVIV